MTNGEKKFNLILIVVLLVGLGVSWCIKHEPHKKVETTCPCCVKK